jgi:DNA polymerase-1
MAGADRRRQLTSVDTETTSLDPMTAQLVGISLSVEAGKGAYIPVAHRYAGVPEQLARELVLEQLKGWLENPDKPKVGQNLKYDSHIFANHGVTLRGIVHDTLLQSYVFESHKPHDMDNMALRHLGYTTIPFIEVCGKGAARSASTRSSWAARPSMPARIPTSRCACTRP